MVRAKNLKPTKNSRNAHKEGFKKLPEQIYYWLNCTKNYPKNIVIFWYVIFEFFFILKYTICTYIILTTLTWSSSIITWLEKYSYGYILVLPVSNFLLKEKIMYATFELP